MSADHLTVIVNRQNLLRRECPFVGAAGTHCQHERISVYHRAKISASARYPAPRIESFTYFNHMRSDLFGAFHLHHSKLNQPSIECAKVAQTSVCDLGMPFKRGKHSFSIRN